MVDKWKSLVARTCYACGKKFQVQYQSAIRPRGGLYCSRACNPRFKEVATSQITLEVGAKRALVAVACEGCGTIFSTRVRNIARGGGRYCSRACNPSYAKKYSPSEKYRRYNLSRNYGLSTAEFERMRSAQNGRCAICRSLPDYPHGVLVVDHSHLQNRVRQLLCNNCNMAIGLVRDDPVTAVQLVAYLLRHDPVEADLQAALDVLLALKSQIAIDVVKERRT